MPTSSSLAYVIPEVQTYSWGYKGDASLVGRMWKRSRNALGLPENVAADYTDTPYAELWYGTHPNAMNQVVIGETSGVSKQLTTVPMNNFLTEHLQFSHAVDNNSSGTLPYLLKIISNALPLSLQCHPDKKTAQRLFRANPRVYRDPNHKPEISIALRENVEALCGFRCCSEIHTILKLIRESHALFGEDCLALQHGWGSELTQRPHDAATEQMCLKDLMQRVLTADEECATRCVAKVKDAVPEYLKRQEIPSFVKDALGVFLKLAEQYPNDSGCFAAFFLNHVVTQPGESLYIPPNVLHAYLEGQIVECMACSDNVIRGGLTPKFKDATLLLDILHYSPYKDFKLQPETVDLKYNTEHPSAVEPKTWIYDPKLPDFKVYIIRLPEGSRMEQFLLLSEDQPAIVVLLCGTALVSLSENGGASAAEGDSPAVIRPGHSLVVPSKVGIRLVNQHTVSTLDKKSASKAASIPKNMFQIDFQSILEGSTEGPCLAVIAAVGGASCTTF